MLSVVAETTYNEGFLYILKQNSSLELVKKTNNIPTYRLSSQIINK